MVFEFFNKLPKPVQYILYMYGQSCYCDLQNTWNNFDTLFFVSLSKVVLAFMEAL